MLRVSSCLFLAVCLLCLSSVNGEVCITPRLPDFFHDIEGQLCIIDQTTLIIRGFGYDGGGPEAYLYYYETGGDFAVGNIPGSGGGKIIPYPGSASGLVPQERVSGLNLEFSLPQGTYACDMAVFTIWCDRANTHFTAVNIPQNIFTTDPAEASDGSKILCTRTGGGGSVVYDNCEQLGSELTMEWTLDRSGGNITVRLCGCTGGNTNHANTWMGVGLSGSSEMTQMFEADAVITWVDSDNVAHAEDYYLSDYAQCRGGVGACPDTLDSSGLCSNDAFPIDGSLTDGVQCVVFDRSLTAGDQCDRTLNTTVENQYIVWGMGGLEETAFIHFDRAERGDPPLNFGRESSRRCSGLQCTSCSSAFKNQRLVAADNATFVARIGPSGAQRGYMGITGSVGWGIAWYINDTLIPELVVQRGKTYTFIVFGGDDSTQNANYHPFYITDSTNGGRAFNDEEQMNSEVVYGGVVNEQPVGVGPLCAYSSNPEAESVVANCDSLLCNYEEAITPPASGCGASAQGNSFTWTPDGGTPDTVYYQCLTHRNLGWKIMVTDSVEQYLRQNPREVPPANCPSVATSTVATSPVATSPVATSTVATSTVATSTVATSTVATSTASSHLLLFSLFLVLSIALLFY